MRALIQPSLRSLALALSSTGCSLLFVNTAAPPAPRDCTSSRLAPVVDSVLAGYQTLRTGAALSADDELYKRYGVPREADVAVGATLTALFLGSAVYGYIKTAECGRLRRSYVSPADQIFWNDRTAPTNSFASAWTVGRDWRTVDARATSVTPRFVVRGADSTATRCDATFGAGPTRVDRAARLVQVDDERCMVGGDRLSLPRFAVDLCPNHARHD